MHDEFGKANPELPVPHTHHSVRFSITDPGDILATGNGYPTNHE